MIKIEQTNWEWVDINKLKTDGENPNSMTDKEKAALKKNIEKFGWNMPIITNMNYLIADGEQKLIVAKEMNLPKVPVLRKELTDNQRRILRQSMNKLRGSHNEELDAEEFKKILAESNLEDLTLLTAISEQEILNAINKTDQESKDILDKEMDVSVERTIDCPHCKGKIKILKKGEVKKG